MEREREIGGSSQAPSQPPLQPSDRPFPCHGSSTLSSSAFKLHRVGRYDIGEVLGCGAFGTVFLGISATGEKASGWVDLADQQSLAVCHPADLTAARLTFYLFRWLSRWWTCAR